MNDGDYSSRAYTAALLCGDAQRGELTRIALSCDCRIIESDMLLPLPDVDILLIDVASFPGSLQSIGEYMEQRRTQALVWAELDELDEAYILPIEYTRYLIGASKSEAVATLSALLQPAAHLLHDSSRDTDYRTLHQISDELAGFARKLALFADQELAPLPPGTAITAGEIRNIIRHRRLRERYFEPGLFADPAWDILLDLLAAEMEQKRVSVSSLCIAAAVPPTTALRWISAMTQNGILLRQQDNDDARRVFLSLSQGASNAVRQYFADISGHKMVI